MIGMRRGALCLAVLIVASPLMTGVAKAAPPALALATPAAGASTQTSPVFSGTTDCTQGSCSGVTVSIYAGTAAAGTPVRTLTATTAASWSVPSGSPFSDGTYTVTAAQSRNTGSGGTTITAPRTFVIDTTGPIVTFDPAGTTSTAEGSDVTFSYSIYDAGIGTLSSIDTSCGAGAFLGGGNTDTDGSIDCHFADGPNATALTGVATDSLGNQGVAASWSVTVTNDAPTVTITGGAASLTDGQSSTYTYSISDPGQDDVQAVAVSCGSGTASNATNTDVDGSFDCAFPSVGVTEVSAAATDSDGDVGAPGSSSVDVTQSNRAPTVDGIAGTTTPTEGDTAAYTVTAADPDGDALVYSWSITSGTALFDGPTDGAATRVMFPAPGTVTLSVDVSDPAGLSVTRTTTIEVAPLPLPESEPTLPEPEPIASEPDPEPTMPEPAPESTESSPAPDPLPEAVPSPPPDTESGTGGTPGPGTPPSEPLPSATGAPVGASDLRPPTAAVKVSDEVISPNGDGRMDLFRLHATFDEPTWWTVELRDGERVMATDRGVGVVVQHIWDGTVGGAPAAEGIYTWHVTGLDGAGNEMESVDGEIAVDRTAPPIRTITVVRKIKMRAMGKPALRVMVEESAHVEVMLVGKGRVTRIAATSCTPGKPVAVRWSGRDASGKRLEPGVYRLHVAATDRAWNRSVLDAGRVIVTR